MYNPQNPFPPKIFPYPPEVPALPETSAGRKNSLSEMFFPSKTPLSPHDLPFSPPRITIPFSAFMITKKRVSVNLCGFFVIKYVILFLTDLQRFIVMPEIQFVFSIRPLLSTKICDRSAISSIQKCISQSVFFAKVSLDNYCLFLYNSICNKNCNILFLLVFLALYF